MADPLPLVLTGPILRRAQVDRVIFWLVTREPVHFALRLQVDGQAQSVAAQQMTETVVQWAERAWMYLIDIDFSAQHLPENQWLGYDLILSPEARPTVKLGWRDWAPELAFPDRELPGFFISPALETVLHGSCRKPHHSAPDGLLRAERLLAEAAPEKWPSLIIMSGDQVYADDVAGPMLHAIHQLIDVLGFANEPLPASEVADSDQLHRQTPLYYQRERILPDSAHNDAVGISLFRGARKPIFTSVHAQNHLVSLAEMMSMYLLVWSPACWTQVTVEVRPPAFIPADCQDSYRTECERIHNFSAGLTRVRRLLAHIPSAMIFDDHDVTDDWNLTAGWERAAYGHPLAQRIIGNAVIAYALCQGMGNAPESMPETLAENCQSVFRSPGTERHRALIRQLLHHNHWYYRLPTQPPIIVLDTRTQRWRSERNPNRPSGLMDWESLQLLREELEDLDAAVLVSAAPIFGVKLIETIQAGFTLLGKPLVVDAENWMAHEGAANSLLDIFLHRNTPQRFIILSGDVHYSFVYDIELRHQSQQPEIWQITSSGIKNAFPDRLLDVFDRLNRWLFAPYSPLNLFTKRRGLRVTPRKPEQARRGERLLNRAGVGLVKLDADGSVREVWQLSDEGDIRFIL